jgi:hypothetical protein
VGCDPDFVVEASEPETVDLLGALHRSVVTAQGRRAGKSSAIPEPGMHFGDMVVEFNPLTGDLTVTGVQAIGGIAPGKIRLSSKRRDGEGEIGVPG